MRRVLGKAMMMRRLVAALLLQAVSVVALADKTPEVAP
jgi:predicted ATPase